MARAMKDSGVEWIGKIPENWNVTKIKYFYDCYDGKRIPVDSELRKSGPYPYWGAGSIMDYVDDYLFDEELILLGEDGAPFFDYTRPVAFLINEKVWVNNHIHVLKPKPSVESRFLVYWLNNVDYKSYINGSILNKLTQSNMNSIAFIEPPLQEQASITNYLDAECAHIDAVIEQTRASIEEYKKLKQAVITQAVTKGIRPNRPMKNSGVEWIGEIPEDWECKPIKYVALFQPSCDTSRLQPDSEITYTPMECIKNGYYIQNVAPFGAVAASLTPFENGDVAMAKVTPCFENGNIAIMDNLVSGFGMGSSELFVYRPTAIEAQYLLYWLQNDLFKQAACATMTGTGGLKRVSPYFAKHSPMTVPTSDEQHQIVKYLNKKCDEIDRLIVKKQQAVTELESYKKSLIYEYVTGKKEA